MNARFGFLRCLVFLLVSQASGCRDADHVQGGLKQEAYVWNRMWPDGGFAPLSDVPATVQGLVVLAAEVHWRLSRFEVTEIAADFGQLKSFGRPVGLAIRMGYYPGPFRADDQAGKLLVDLATRLVKEAERNQCSLHELQIDFDCAESKLEGYRVWVKAIRQAVKPVSITFTALPSWLDCPAFDGLARAADGYVLQVHSVEPPGKMDGPIRLCDPVCTRRWVEIAARVGVPFRVALPTYSCWLVFNREGRLIKVNTNPYRPYCEDGGRIRKVEADPFAMADLVQEWKGYPKRPLFRPDKRQSKG